MFGKLSKTKKIALGFIAVVIFVTATFSVIECVLNCAPSSACIKG